MSQAGGVDVDVAAARRWRQAWWLPGVVTAAVFVGTDLVLERGVREPATWGGAFGAVMNVATLIRLAVLFTAPLVTWPWARSWGASVPRALAVGLAGPVTYAVSAVWHGLSYYPPAEALYYGTNPIVVGAVAGSLGAGALGEWAWRWWRCRVAHGRGGPSGAPPPRWWLLGAAVLGAAATYAVLFWDGGIHWFYVWIAGYRVLFT